VRLRVILEQQGRAVDWQDDEVHPAIVIEVTSIPVAIQFPNISKAA
jgi:hypothetical protein